MVDRKHVTTVSTAVRSPTGEGGSFVFQNLFWWRASVIAPSFGVGPLSDRGSLNKLAASSRQRSSVQLLWTFLSARGPRLGCLWRDVWVVWAKGQWRIGRYPIRPVLKHGPRSLTRVRVMERYETQRRNEGEGRFFRSA